MNKNIKLFKLLALLLFATAANAQEATKEEQLFKYAQKLQQEEKLNDALTIYKNLLKNDSSNIEYLWRTSFIYSKIGVDQPTETARQQWYQTAAYLARKAVTQFPQNAYAHYVYAMALGRMSENASSKVKIDNARQIKTEAETAIKLNPKLAGPYHIMGRWHRVVAGFSGFERTMIKAIFGGIPGGSYDDAIRYFEKAIVLEPTNAIHYYELAVSYLERNETNDKEQAKHWLQKALLIQVVSNEDAANKSKCEALLKKISG
jgi:tetratricopeptide (TPR) repeat protein